VDVGGGVIAVAFVPIMNELLLTLATPVLVVVLITASLLVITNDWRLNFITLAVQYVGAALLIAPLVTWPVMGARLIAGGCVIGIFVFTGRQVNYGRQAASPLPGLTNLPALIFPTSFAFRLMATIMIAAVAGYAASLPELALPNLPLTLNIASFALIALGLLNLGFTEEPMNAGLGLLTALTGFNLFYPALETSLAVVALLVAVDFSVALAVSHLALLRYPVSPTTNSTETNA